MVWPMHQGESACDNRSHPLGRTILVWLFIGFPARAQRLFSLGLMLGLAAAAISTIWERTAFTGLLNFSSDYRTTGMFWEMHVGGA